MRWRVLVIGNFVVMLRTANLAHQFIIIRLPYGDHVDTFVKQLTRYRLFTLAGCPCHFRDRYRFSPYRYEYSSQHILQVTPRQSLLKER